jgi:hypothetical protein
VESGSPTTISITNKVAAAANPSAASTPITSVASPVVGNPQTQVGSAQSLLLGTSDTPSVFASYHLEYTNLTPKWIDGAITPSKYSLSADVQGKNIHFTENSKGKTTEVILIGDQEYDVNNGTLTPRLGLAGLDWAMWPLDSVMVLTVGSLKTETAGTDTLGGRSLEIYTITGKISDDSTGMIASLGTGVTAVNGKVWIDQATGGLVRAVADYESDVKDSSGSVVGHGSGHL